MMTKEDLQKYKALKQVMKQGSYNLKGDAILAVASLLAWYDELEKEFEAQAKASSIENMSKKVKTHAVE